MANELEAFRILHDGLRLLVIQVADGRDVGSPAVLSLRAVPAPDVPDVQPEEEIRPRQGGLGWNRDQVEQQEHGVLGGES